MQAVRRLDKGVVSKHALKTEGRTQLATFVNEDDLYNVILDSRRLTNIARRGGGRTTCNICFLEDLGLDDVRSYQILTLFSGAR